MIGNLVFIFFVSGCLIAIVILLIIQFIQSRKNIASQDNESTPEKDSLSEKTMSQSLSYKKTMRSYYLTLNKIEKIYSSANANLSSLTEKQLTSFYNLCSKNVFSFQRIREMEKESNSRTVENVPAYKYLSELYVIKNDYGNAINACATALQLEACDDSEKQNIKERIILLAEKGDYKLTDAIIELLK